MTFIHYTVWYRTQSSRDLCNKKCLPMANDILLLLIVHLMPRLVSECGEIQNSIGLLNNKLREAETAHQVRDLYTPGKRHIRSETETQQVRDRDTPVQG